MVWFAGATPETSVAAELPLLLASSLCFHPGWWCRGHMHQPRWCTYPSLFSDEPSLNNSKSDSPLDALSTKLLQNSLCGQKPSEIFQRTQLKKAVAVRDFLLEGGFRQILTLLESSSLIFQQHKMLFLPRFGHFLARKMAAGQSAPPSGILLDFLLRDRHSLLEFLCVLRNI